MHLPAYLPLFLPVLAAVAAGPLAERLEPRLATWLLTSVAVALAALGCAALGILAVAGAVRLPLLAWLGHWSSAVVRAGDPVSGAEAALAAGSAEFNAGAVIPARSVLDLPMRRAWHDPGAGRQRRERDLRS